MESILTVYQLSSLYENKIKELSDFIDQDKINYNEEAERYNKEKLELKDKFMAKWETIDKDELKAELLDKCYEDVECEQIVDGMFFDRTERYTERELRYNCESIALDILKDKSVYQEEYYGYSLLGKKSDCYSWNLYNLPYRIQMIELVPLGGGVCLDYRHRIMRDYREDTKNIEVLSSLNNLLTKLKVLPNTATITLTDDELMLLSYEPKPSI